MKAYGFEISEETHQAFKRNLTKACDSHGFEADDFIVERKDSADVEDWSMVSIMLQYDGPAQGASYKRDTTHKKIMQNIFKTKQIRCVLSTKLDIHLFRNYFEDDSDVDFSSWRVRTLHDERFTLFFLSLIFL